MHGGQLVLVCAAWLLLNGLAVQHGRRAGAGHPTRNGLWIGISLLLLTLAWGAVGGMAAATPPARVVMGMFSFRKEARSRLTQRLAGCFKCLAFVVLVG